MSSFITFQGKIEGIVVCKPNDRDLLRNFESALRFGKPVLLENVGQELDPALDPVLKVSQNCPGIDYGLLSLTGNKKEHIEITFSLC